jgi:hypothetical protein
MAAAERANRDKEMAADLRRRGIFHGIRPHRTLADPMQYLHPDLVGTARYRRHVERTRKKK